MPGAGRVGDGLGQPLPARGPLGPFTSASPYCSPPEASGPQSWEPQPYLLWSPLEAFALMKGTCVPSGEARNARLLTCRWEF